MNLVKEAEGLLKKCKVCTVASVSENGYPRICVLVPIKTDGIKTFYFSTGTNSTKVKHFLKNPKAGVTFYDGGDSATLTGEMSVVQDKTLKDSLWQDWLAKHFPNGGKEDPQYAIIKFVADEGTIYVGGHFDTVKI